MFELAKPIRDNLRTSIEQHGSEGICAVVDYAYKTFGLKHQDVRDIISQYDGVEWYLYLGFNRSCTVFLEKQPNRIPYGTSPAMRRKSTRDILLQAIPKDEAVSMKEVVDSLAESTRLSKNYISDQLRSCVHDGLIRRFGGGNFETWKLVRLADVEQCDAPQHVVESGGETAVPAPELPAIDPQLEDLLANVHPLHRKALMKIKAQLDGMGFEYSIRGVDFELSSEPDMSEFKERVTLGLGATPVGRILELELINRDGTAIDPDKAFEVGLEISERLFDSGEDFDICLDKGALSIYKGVELRSALLLG